MTPTRRHFILGAGASCLGATPLLHAQTPAPAKVKFTLDWARQGSNAYVDMGKDKGFFREAGVDITIDRGFGSGRVPTDVAAGAYDMGQADIGPVIKFMAQNPESDLVIVGIWGDRSLMAVTVRADGDIRTPKDLEGRTLAAPESDAGRQLFPAFAKAAKVDATKVNWLTVASELREPMLLQKRADGITGAYTSTGMSLKAIGMDLPQQRAMFYRDFGVDLLGYCYITTRRFLKSQPDAARGTLKGLYRSLVYANAHRAESIAVLKRVEPLTDVAIETQRQDIAFDEHMISPNAKSNGLSVVDPARFQRVLRTVEDAYGLPPRLTMAGTYDAGFLPVLADRRL